MTAWPPSPTGVLDRLLTIGAAAAVLWLTIAQDAHWIIRAAALTGVAASAMAVALPLRDQHRQWLLVAIALLSGLTLAALQPAEHGMRAALLATCLAHALVLPALIPQSQAGHLIRLAVLTPVVLATAIQGHWGWALGLMGLAGVSFAVLATTAQHLSATQREATLARDHADTALAAARQAVQEKTRFLAAASHDLRQPVHAIGLFVGALKGEIREGRGRYLVERLERSMVGLDELFNRLLDISRLDAGTIEPRLSTLPILPLLQTLESRFTQLAQQRHLDFRVHLPAPCLVRTDPALLVEILMNLLSNAFRYTERGGILLGTRRRGERLLIQVWDTGIGIAPEQTEAVFEEFVQLGNNSRDRRQGLGLGLSIVRRLSESLASPVALRSRLGRGSVFEVSVPLAGESNDLMRLTEPDEDAGQLQGLLVLAVDDEIDILIGMEALLVSWGCFVLLARSVAEATRQLEQTERFPDLLITDHRLGANTTSLDVIAALQRAVPVPVGIIVISGDATPALQASADAQGWAVLPKPVNPDRLRRLALAMTRPD